MSSEYGETIGDKSFCYISSLLPDDSTTQEKTQTICYETSCDSKNKNVILTINSKKVTCPFEGGRVESPIGFKGSVECPKYDDICSLSNNIICNEMFDCLKKLADNDGYDYSGDNKNYGYSQAYLSINYILFLIYALIFVN